MPLNTSLTLCLLYLEGENKNQSNLNYIYAYSDVWLCCAIENMRIWLSIGGCKILNISDRNMIGLALIMEVIKAGGAILINLPHCQRVEIIEAAHEMTTESRQTSTLLNHSTEALVGSIDL